jgi:hypothetical protein
VCSSDLYEKNKDKMKAKMRERYDAKKPQILQAERERYIREGLKTYKRERYAPTKIENECYRQLRALFA